MEQQGGYFLGYQAGAADARQGNTPPIGWERWEGTWADGYRHGREDALDEAAFGTFRPLEAKARG